MHPNAWMHEKNPGPAQFFATRSMRRELMRKSRDETPSALHFTRIQSRHRHGNRYGFDHVNISHKDAFHSANGLSVNDFFDRRYLFANVRNRFDPSSILQSSMNNNTQASRAVRSSQGRCVV
jgi:hypothetical protein